MRTIRGRLSVSCIRLCHILGLTNLSDQQIEEYSNVVGRLGPGSQEAQAVREKYKHNRSFLIFADSLDHLKRELGGSGMDSQDTAILFGEYADAMNRHGRDSEQAKKVLTDNGDNAEFIELAQVAYLLRKKHDDSM